MTASAFTTQDHLTAAQSSGGEGPGGSLVSIYGLMLTVILGAALAILILYSMLKIWPRPTPSGEAEKPTASSPAADSQQVAAPAKADQARTESAKSGKLDCDTSVVWRAYPLGANDSMREPECVSLFARSFPLWAEQRLLLITILAGALGGLVHALRSLSWYIGNRELRNSWLPHYLLLPLTGSLVAASFYLVIRGGFFSPSGSFRDTSPFGFAAMAVLVGMFSSPAALKLQVLAETIFTKPEPGRDSAPPQREEKQPEGSPSPPTAPSPNAPSTDAADSGERGELPSGPADAGTQG